MGGVKKRRLVGMELPDIPEEILLQEVLPRLPVKSLCRCKGVSRRWLNYISCDPHLALLQSLHASHGAVYLKNRSLEIFPTPDAPVLPNPSVGFEDAKHFKLLTSANGLLCLHVRPANSSEQFLYVCNPLTGEGERIPDSEHRGSFVWDRASIGLAFELSATPSCYTLVHLLRNNGIKAGALPLVEYGFDVFSSETGQWVRSSEYLLISDFLYLHNKVVFAQGTLYWECQDRLLFYHLAGDRAGTIMLPDIAPPNQRSKEQEMGVWDGRVTLTKVSNMAVEVWVMTALGESWERKYRVQLNKLIMEYRDIFSKFWHSMRRRGSNRLRDRLMLRPLPYEGGQRLYLRMGTLWWQKESRQHVCCYNIRTEKAEEFSADGLSELGHRERFFSYHNSLVRLPKIANSRREV